MANQENLKPITTNERARELGSKGGKVKTLAKKMINRKHCNSTCPMWNNCWAKHTSHIIYEQAVEKATEQRWSAKAVKNIKIKCALKTLPSQVIEGSKRIILDGEEGFNNEMMEQIMRFKNDIMVGTITVRDRERYLLQLREVKKSIYGDKSRLEAVIDKNLLTAEDFAVAYEEHKRSLAAEAENKVSKVKT